MRAGGMPFGLWLGLLFFFGADEAEAVEGEGLAAVDADDGFAVAGEGREAAVAADGVAAVPFDAPSVCSGSLALAGLRGWVVRPLRRWRR